MLVSDIPFIVYDSKSFMINQLHILALAGCR